MTRGRHGQVRPDRLLIEIVVRRVAALEGRWGSTTRRAARACLGVLGVAVGARVVMSRYALPQSVPAFAVVLLLALLTGSAGSAANSCGSSSSE